MSALSAGTVRLIGTFAIGAFILAGADGRVFAQTGGKIPGAANADAHLLPECSCNVSRRGEIYFFTSFPP